MQVVRSNIGRIRSRHRIDRPPDGISTAGLQADVDESASNDDLVWIRIPMLLALAPHRSLRASPTFGTTTLVGTDARPVVDATNVGQDAARRGAALISSARDGLVLRPVVNREPGPVLRWLESGGELIGNDQGIGSIAARRGEPMKHWLSLQFLPSGPIEDALTAVGRDRLGQDRFGPVAVLLDDAVLERANVLPTSWFTKPTPPAGTIHGIDDVLFARRTIELEHDDAGRAGARSVTSADVLANLESLGRDGIRTWLTDGRMSAATPFHAFRPTHPHLDPIEAISPKVTIEDIVGIRIEPDARPADARRVRAAAAKLGIPVSGAR